MKKKPTITLIRGNIPKLKTISRRSISCWRCGVAVNDRYFEVPGQTLRDFQGNYYKKAGKSYCSACMKDNILRTEKELTELKKQVG